MSSIRRLWNVVRRSHMDDDLKQELDTHLALIEEEGRAHGLSADEARQEARLRFGNPLAYRSGRSTPSSRRGSPTRGRT